MGKLLQALGFGGKPPAAKPDPLDPMLTSATPGQPQVEEAPGGKPGAPQAQPAPKASDNSIHHCCFCGSANVVGGSDGTVECGFCQKSFKVYAEPSHPFMPQTIDGEPYTPAGEDPITGEPIPAAGAPAPAAGGPPGPTPVPSGLEKYRVDAAAPGAPGAAAPGGIEQYRTASGALLSREHYLQHIALLHADNKPAVISMVRQANKRPASLRLMASSSLQGQTCTIGPNAVTGERCGKPAVTSFTGKDGVTYYECAEHSSGEGTPTGDLKVGDKVTVNHVGIDKPGTVVSIKGQNVQVEVPSRDTTKVITRPLSEVKRTASRTGAAKDDEWPRTVCDSCGLATDKDGNCWNTYCPANNEEPYDDYEE